MIAKTIYTLALIAALAGCNELPATTPVTNEEIREATKACKDAGMDVQITTDAGRPVWIFCIPGGRGDRILDHGSSSGVIYDSMGEPR